MEKTDQTLDIAMEQTHAILCSNVSCSLKYQNKLDEYVSTIWNNRYLIEFTKRCSCCSNYSFFLPMHKNYTLNEVYRNIILVTELDNVQLYLEDSTSCRLDIHRDSDMTLQMFIRQNAGMFVPIYPLPMKVVYRIYYDDGNGSEHSHS